MKSSTYFVENLMVLGKPFLTRRLTLSFVRKQLLTCFLHKILTETAIATKRKTFRTRFKGEHDESLMGYEDT